MKKLVPFLKLYTEYVKNFEKALQLVDQTEQKSSAFATLLTEVRVKQLHKYHFYLIKIYKKGLQ